MSANIWLRQLTWGSHLLTHDMSSDGRYELAKHVALYGAVGLVISPVIGGLASVTPSVFGWLTLPFWVLPPVANVRAHHLAVVPLLLLSGTVCYGLVAFLISRWRTRRVRRCNQRREF